MFNEFVEEVGGLIPDVGFPLILHVHQVLVAESAVLAVLALAEVGADHAQVNHLFHSYLCPTAIEGHHQLQHLVQRHFYRLFLLLQLVPLEI